MKKNTLLYTSILIFVLLLVLSILVYLFYPAFVEFINKDVDTNIPTTEITNEETVMTKEEQVDLLQEMAPENSIDTPEEMEAEVEKLDELQNNSNNQSDADQLNQLQGESSTEAQLRQLEALQN